MQNLSAPTPRRTLFRYRRSSGFMTVIVLFLMLVIAVLMAGMASMSQNQLKSSRNGLLHAKALTLSESGMDDTVERLSNNHDYAGTGTSTTTLYEASNVPFGTFKTSVTSIDFWTRKVVATGTTTENATANLTAIVAIKKIKLGSDNGAIRSANTIEIKGTADILTAPANQHVANCDANGTISMGGSSVVDGALNAYGGVLSGQGYYPNSTAKTMFPFLNDSVINTMKQGWLTTAQAGGTMNGSSINKNTVINGSQYISGNVKLTSSDTLTLKGGGNAVVFINGDVTITGNAVLTNGVTLIVNGTFNQSGGTVYKVISGLPTPTLFVCNSNNATVGVSLAGGGVGDAQGIVYGAKGDFNVAGGAVLGGAIYCGDPNGGVKCPGNFTLNYPLGMESIIEEPGNTFVTQILEL